MAVKIRHGMLVLRTVQHLQKNSEAVRRLNIAMILPCMACPRKHPSGSSRTVSQQYPFHVTFLLGHLEA